MEREREHGRDAVRVVLVDDDPWVLKSLRLLLEVPGIEVVDTCQSVWEGVQAIHTQRPHVALVDLMMPGNPRAGVDLIAQVRQARQPVHAMLFTVVDPDGALLCDAIRAGARGYWRKDSVPGLELPVLIQRLANKEIVVEPALLQQWLSAINPENEQIPRPAKKDPPHLSERQREILLLIYDGRSIGEIARHLYLSQSTVKTHLAKARAKFPGQMSNDRLAVYCLLHGLLVE